MTFDHADGHVLAYLRCCIPKITPLFNGNPKFATKVLEGEKRYRQTVFTIENYIQTKPKV